MVDIGVLHPVLHIDNQGDQVQVAGHIFVCVTGHDGLHFPDRPFIDLNEGPGRKIVQSRLQVPPVNLAQQAAVTDLSGTHDRKTAAEEQGDDQTGEHPARRSRRREDAAERPAAGQAPPRRSPAPEQRPQVEQQILPAASHSAGAEPPDDQGDQAQGAPPLQRQNGWRFRRAEVHGNGQTRGKQQDVDQNAYDDGHHDHHRDVDGREARAELAGDDRDSARVGCRTRHEKDQSRSGTETLGDQRRRDRSTGGCANVEGNAHQHHDRVGHPAGILVRHQIARNHQKEHASQGDPDEQRKKDVVGYFDETVAKDVPDDGLEAWQLGIHRLIGRGRAE